MLRIECILLHNPKYVGLPSLIEISNRATTRLQDLDFVENSTVCPRHEMHYMLKTLKLPSIINNNVERISLIKKLTQITISNKDIRFKKEDYHIVAIKFLIEIKLKTKINSIKEKWTRSDSNKFNMMINLLNENVKKKEKQLMQLIQFQRRTISLKNSTVKNSSLKLLSIMDKTSCIKFSFLRSLSLSSLLALIIFLICWIFSY